MIVFKRLAATLGALSGRTNRDRLVAAGDPERLSWALWGRQLAQGERDEYYGLWVGRRRLGEFCVELVESPEFERHASRYGLRIEEGTAASSGFDPSLSPLDILLGYRLLLLRRPDPSGWANYRGAGDLSSFVSALLCSEEFRSTAAYRTAVRRDEHRDTRIVDIAGLQIEVSTHDPVNRAYMRGEVAEPHVERFLRATLKPGMFFCDVGANVGFYTILAASIVGREGRVVAFESRAQNAQYTCRNVARNGLSNVVVLPFALTDAPSLKRYVRAEGTNGYVLHLESGQTVLESTNEEIVQGIRLEDMACLLTRLDVIKMDIEGGEGSALRGASRLIQEHLPVIVTEFSPTQLARSSGISGREYLEALAAFGYEFEILTPGGGEFGTRLDALLARMRELEVAHIDIACRPKGKAHV